MRRYLRGCLWFARRYGVRALIRWEFRRLRGSEIYYGHLTAAEVQVMRELGVALEEEQDNA